MKYTRVLGDGNLLIGSNIEVQMEKAKKIGSVGKVKVSKVAVLRVGEQGSLGVEQFTITILHFHLADAFIQSDVHLRADTTQAGLYSSSVQSKVVKE